MIKLYSDDFDVVYFSIAMLKKSWIILLSMLIGALIAIAFISNNKVYTAKTTIYSIVKTSYEENIFDRDALEDYAELILSDRVLNRALLNLTQYDISVDDLRDSALPVYVKGSPALTIESTSPDSQLSIDIANSIQEAFLDQLILITGADSFRVLDYADNATSSLSLLKILRYGIIGSVVFGFLVFMLLAILEIFDNRIKTIDDIKSINNVKLIGMIPNHDI